MSTLRAVGVPRVLMMPDNAGLGNMVSRALSCAGGAAQSFPSLEFVDMPASSTVHDTFRAVRQMQARGVRAIIVLGGDGTHRAVAREIIDGVSRGLAAVPISGVSTGTNNAFPAMREPTVTALAVGCYAVGRVPAHEALTSNKILEVRIGADRRDIAIVDAVVSTERYVGAKALWKPDSLKAAFLTFADPQSIGLSAVGGLLHPVKRTDSGGLAVYLSSNITECRLSLKAPIAPGMICDLGIVGWQPMIKDTTYTLDVGSGIVALDGEREMSFEQEDVVQVAVRADAFLTVDVSGIMATAAQRGLLQRKLPANQNIGAIKHGCAKSLSVVACEPARVLPKDADHSRIRGAVARRIQSR